MIADRQNNIANLHPGLHRRHVWFDIGDVNAASLARLAGEFSQLRIARWKKRKTDGRKTTIMFALRFLQEMCNDRRRDRVDELSPRIVTQKKTGELVVLNQRNGVAVFPILNRNADPVSEKLADIDRVMRHLNRCDQTFSGDQCAGLL